MIDTKLITDNIAGMIARGKLLREDEKVFIKVQGISETIIKSQNDVEKEKTDLEAEKANLKILKAKKTKAVSGSVTKIIAKMNEVLPLKNAVFECTDGLVMGMRDGDTVLRFNSLSGGQEHEMKAALNNVLGANILVIEGAEFDYDRIAAVLEDLAGIDKQIILNTCLPPKSDEWPNSYSVPEEFDLVEL